MVGLRWGVVFDEVQVNDSKRYRVSSWGGGGKAPGKIRLGGTVEVGSTEQAPTAI